MLVYHRILNRYHNAPKNQILLTLRQKYNHMQVYNRIAYKDGAKILGSRNLIESFDAIQQKTCIEP